MDVSRVTTKGQVTIPKKIREATGIIVGDLVRFTLAEGVVSLTRVAPDRSPGGDGQGLNLEEWDSAEDADAWSDL
jgi:AbrB family looped-hinge helix DNA binding protein